MKLILIGFMGSGKSTIADALSHKLAIEHHDLDQLIEKQSGFKIPAYFEQFGEAQFREFEHQTLIDALELDGIVSTGGGTPVQDANFDLLVQHPTPTVFLNATDETVLKRLLKDDVESRPLFQELGATGLIELKHARQPKYEQLADIIIDVNDKTPAQIVDEIVNQLNQYQLEH
ncbi:shikimate kinase (plasmid) [Nicoliella spurrieriana]|uniref:Shikimate kinase n=1 Tax=Nicoliella spurrieriana TaxID=2925830 RepID=A0A976RQQ6_9LACO|nr:shikimate kinase [Nicoliella spurrieriana]UQS86019.1 shikimate kinase [Nicoliella spurrieriana]